MEIADIKAKLSILEVLQHYGLKPNKNKMLCCPFHPDKNPSMQVYPETNTVHCFSGNCEHTGKAIDQIDFIMLMDKCSKHMAILKAKKLIGETIITNVNQNHKTMSNPNLTEIFFKLQEALPRSKKALEYLESRNLTQVSEIGYNSGTNYSSMQQCVIFPLKDQQGKVVSLYGRAVGRDGHYYSKDRTGLYPGYPHAETRTLVLTESVIDAATVKKFTTYEVLALYGTNGLTQEHTEAISQLKELKEVIFFLDGDEAGDNAVSKYKRKLEKLLPHIQLSKVETPQGEDPNSLTISHAEGIAESPAEGGKPDNILNHLIENRTVFSSTEVESLDTQLIPTPEPAKFSPKEVARQMHSNGTPSKLNTDNSEYLIFTKIPLLISVLGGIGLHPIDKLRVTLKIERTDSNTPLHQIRHSLDLYHDDQVEKLTRKTAERLELGSREVQITIAEMIQALENHRQYLIDQTKPKKPETRIIPPEREKTAIGIMKRKNYLKTILPELLAKTGVVGEVKNSLILWTTYGTRKQKDPLHVICLGASGTGKTFLQERITDLVPEEDKVSGTAISENALYYAQDLNLRNKLFIIEDLDGASNILYALRELQTKKIITKLVTQKDSKGNMKTEIVTVHGPICLTATTTKERLYEDNANRCLLIYLDGSKEQQEAIMDDQRKRSAGKINQKEREEVRELLRDMQALYQPITVRNPYAEQLKIPETVFKPLRTNSHYLAFIEGITFCMQFQRQRHKDPETGEQFINTEIEDIELANELMKEVLLSKSDELTKACRGFFEGLTADLQREKKTSFYRNEVREWKRINPNNLRYYLKQLVQYGYLNIIGRHKHNGHEYEISKLSDYQDLNGSLCNVLDSCLEDVKKRVENP